MQTKIFSPDPADFVWAAGIEDTFIPQARPGLRKMDEYELTQHYQQWKNDFDLLGETGIKAARWGIPWYKVQPKADQWDWRWTDQALDYLVNIKGITPILDLMHYGTPLWMDNSFVNASYPQRVAEYAHAVASRYKSLVHYYTPLNEPSVNADWAGRKGVWPPYLTGNDGYVKTLLAIAKGIVLTVGALREAQADMETVQVEALWKLLPQDPGLAERVAGNNAEQYLCFDLTTGRVGEGYAMLPFLRKFGASEADLSWLQDHPVTFDYFGANFYPWSYGRVYQRKDGQLYRVKRGVNGRAIAEVMRDAWERYHMPMLVTETSALRDVEGRMRWMDETIGAVYGLRGDGIPVIGYTWFPLFSMFSWSYRMGRRPLSDYVIHLGLYEGAFDDQGIFQRKSTPLVGCYQEHMRRKMPALNIS